MRNAIAAAAILLGWGLVIVSPTPALAQYGAIAWDRETGKYGWSWNQATLEHAIAERSARAAQVAAKSL
jgi:hypothetical protein